MRRITEFKGYRSIVEYDQETGEFVSRTLPDVILEAASGPETRPEAEIVPFPEKSEAPLTSRLAG